MKPAAVVTNPEQVDKVGLAYLIHFFVVVAETNRPCSSAKKMWVQIKKMAIFGWNGISALALYLATVGALYGTKDAGLGKGYYKIQQILNRKAALDEKDAGKKKPACLD